MTSHYVLRFSYRDETTTAEESDMEFTVNDNNRALWEVHSRPIHILISFVLIHTLILFGLVWF